MNYFIFQEVLFSYNSIDSTNEEAKRLIKQGNINTCFAVLAKTQTNGKGRMQRNWSSSCNQNLYFTIAIEEKLCENVKNIMPLYTAFTMLNTIGEKAKYKWANDIIIENKKVCGILIEKIDNYFIIGIGVNLNSNPANTIFPSGNLKEFNIAITPEQIFNNFHHNLSLNTKFIINALKNKFFTQQEITINQGEFKGYFHDINEEGNLILRQSNGKLKEICFGDVGINL